MADQKVKGFDVMPKQDAQGRVVVVDDTEYVLSCPKCKEEGRLNALEGGPENPDVVHCIHHGDMTVDSLRKPWTFDYGRIAEEIEEESKHNKHMGLVFRVKEPGGTANV